MAIELSVSPVTTVVECHATSDTKAELAACLLLPTPEERHQPKVFHERLPTHVRIEEDEAFKERYEEWCRRLRSRRRRREENIRP